MKYDLDGDDYYSGYGNVVYNIINGYLYKVSIYIELKCKSKLAKLPLIFAFTMFTMEYLFKQSKRYF